MSREELIEEIISVTKRLEEIAKPAGRIAYWHQENYSQRPTGYV